MEFRWKQGEPITRERLALVAEILGGSLGLAPIRQPGLTLILEMVWDEAAKAAEAEVRELREALENAAWVLEKVRAGTAFTVDELIVATRTLATARALLTRGSR